MCSWFIGILSAVWIVAPKCESSALEKDFIVTGKVESASLRIAAPGFYEASLDGRRIGDAVLDPAPTDYTKRVYFREYPLALESGRHNLTVLLGHGWYDQRTISAWRNHLDKWRDQPCLWAEIEVVFVDGSRRTVGTDGTWRVAQSPIVWDDFREGEIIDPGFVLPRSQSGGRAVEVKGPSGKLVKADFPPSRVMRLVEPVRVWRPVAGGWMFDFGEDVAGWTRISLSGGKRGDVVTIRYDERVSPDGEPTVRIERKDVPRFGSKLIWPENARAIDCFNFAHGSTNVISGGAMQQDRFVLSGCGSDVYEPRFTYKGFRYVWVSGIEDRPSAVACEVHTDFAEIGSFECSDKDFNALMKMVDRAYKANFADGVPTDCPHREKNGWTADAQIASEFAQYAYENTAAYVKWCSDLADAQREDGNIPGVVPTGGWGYEEKTGGLGYGPVWGGAVAVVPWNLYVYRGNTNGLGACYEAMRRFADYEQSHLGKNGMVCHGLGDWIPTNGSYCGDDAFVDVDFVGTAYHYAVLRIVAESARVKGLRADAARYDALAQKAKEQFNAVHCHGNGVYGKGRQTESAVALNFGLVSDAERTEVCKRLVAAVHRAGDRFDGGLVGSKHVFRALSRMGRSDLAFKMLKAKGSPGFMHMKDSGGTALWEDWWTGASRNHIMFGDFACWAYQYLGGIRLEEREGSTAAVPIPVKPGFQHVVIAPDCIDALDWVKCSVETPRGKISSEWQRSGNEIELKVSIPSETVARVVLPFPDKAGLHEHILHSGGEYVFRFAGVVLASQQSGKSLTMGHRMGLQELMAAVPDGKGNKTFKSKEVAK